MASSTRPPFTIFALSTTTTPTPTPTILPVKFKPFILRPLLHRPQTLIRSIDVNKQDEQEQPASASADTVSSSSLEEEVEKDQSKFDKRRLEEKFAVVNTGIHDCRSCGFRYDETIGDSSYPIPPGLPFDRLPEDWRCPTCGASKSFFESKRVEIAGFAQNQQFGLGGNSLTSGQKALLIYGGLLLGFAFFLSGYFLQ